MIVFLMSYNCLVIWSEETDEKRQIQIECNQYRTELVTRTLLLKDTLGHLKEKLDESHVLSACASIRADYELIKYENYALYLQIKDRPAEATAEKILSIVRGKMRESEYKYREMLYRYEVLLNTFPEIKAYLDDVDIVKQEAEEVVNNRAYEDTRSVLGYLSDEEYYRLSEAEREQLSLERYIKG